MTTPVTNPATIGNIGNYYGRLKVEARDGEYFWGIEDWNCIRWEQIPPWLYQALIRYEKVRPR